MHRAAGMCEARLVNVVNGERELRLDMMAFHIHSPSDWETIVKFDVCFTIRSVLTLDLFILRELKTKKKVWVKTFV